MQIINFIKKRWLIILAIVILALMIWILSLDSNKSSDNKNIETNSSPTLAMATPTPLPAVLSGFGPSQTPQEISERESELAQNKIDYPLADKLPYKTQDFIIDHYRSAKTLVVIIYDESKKTEIKNKINEWLENNGSTADSHKIIWTVQN